MPEADRPLDEGRARLLKLLEVYQPSDSNEALSRSRCIDFVRREPGCFLRETAEGHFTGSSWCISEDRTAVLLHFHRKLSRWLQLGGHAEGEPDLLKVALREAVEESGIEQFRALSFGIFDLDVHPIPARPGEPAHLHYDIRFLLEARGDHAPVASEESLDVRWVELSRIDELPIEESVRRMARKSSGCRLSCSERL